MARKKKAAAPDPLKHVPIKPSQKDIGSVRSLELDKAGVESLASMSRKDLATHLKNNPSMDPQLKDAVLKRHMEINATRPAEPKPRVELTDKQKRRSKRMKKGVPTVKRGEGGKIVSARTPLAPLAGETPAPVGPAPKRESKLVVDGTPVRAPKNKELKKFVRAVPIDGETDSPRTRRPRKTTRTGKKLNPDTGKIDTSGIKPGRAAKVDDKVVRVTTDNLEDVKKAAVTTTLPTAGPEKAPSAPTPGTAILPSVLPSSQNKKNYGGFAQSHKVVSKATHEALGHLDTMANTDKGSAEHHDSHEAFNLLHAHIGQIGNKDLHKVLGLGRTMVQQYHGTSQLPQALKVHKGLVLGRLEAGRIAEQARSERSGPGKG